MCFISRQKTTFNKIVLLAVFFKIIKPPLQKQTALSHVDADEGSFYHELFEISYCAVNMTQGITRCCASFAIEADFLLTDLEEKSKAKQKCGFCMFSPQVFPIHRQLYIDDGIHLKDNFTEPAYFHPTSLGSTLVKMR